MSTKRRIKLKVSARLSKKRTRRGNGKKNKKCRFPINKNEATVVDYKNIRFLRNFLTERGKILPSRISGMTCHDQRILAQMIKKARSMALLPYCATQD
jgi:small subunit ribosomal protein S18